MPSSRTRYPKSFKEPLDVLARAGRSVECLTRDYEACAAKIHDWATQTGVENCACDDCFASAEWDELRPLR